MCDWLMSINNNKTEYFFFNFKLKNFKLLTITAEFWIISTWRIIIITAIIAIVRQHVPVLHEVGRRNRTNITEMAQKVLHRPTFEHVFREGRQFPTSKKES